MHIRPRCPAVLQCRVVAEGAAAAIRGQGVQLDADLCCDLFVEIHIAVRPPGRGFGQGVSGPSVAAHLGISWRVWRRAWVCRVVAFVVLFCFGPLQACERCERGKGWLMQTWQLGSTSSQWLPYNGTIPWCDDRVCLCWPHVT